MKSEDENVIFDPKMQDAVLGHMLSDNNFFLRCKQYLIDNTNWFSRPATAQLVKDLFDFHTKYNRPPKTHIEFFDTTYLKNPDYNEVKRMRSALDLCIVAADSIGIDIIKKHMTGWIKVSKFKDAITRSASYFNNKKYDEAIGWVSEKITEIASAGFDDNEFVDFDNAEEFLEEMHEDKKNGISIGNRLFDEVLTGGETYVDDDGSNKPVPALKRGEFTVIVGPSNAGKSQTLVTIARHAVMANHSVLYMVHEDREINIKSKIMRAMTEMDSRDLSMIRQTKDEKKIQEINGAIQKLKTHLDYFHTNKAGGVYVEDMIDKIKLFNKERIAKTGKPYDLIINDYPGRLKAKDLNKKAEIRHEQGYIYSQFLHIAEELGIHCVVSAQTNRAGLKKATNGDLLEMDDIAEAFAIMQVASNVITINRSAADVKGGMARFYVPKSRGGPKNGLYTTRVDMAKSLMFSEKLQGTRATAGFDEMMTQLVSASPLDVLKV